MVLVVMAVERPLASVVYFGSEEQNLADDSSVLRRCGSERFHFADPNSLANSSGVQQAPNIDETSS